MFLNPWYGPAADDAATVAAAAAQPPGDEPPSASGADAQPERASRVAASRTPSTSSAASSCPDRAHEPPTAAIQSRLKPGWTVHLTPEGRLFYCNHINQTSSWLPPIDNWNGSIQGDVGGGGALSLPYGWEAAVDREGKPYFINHLNKTTTYEDPRKDWGDEPPQPRDVELTRHPELGFGFVAGSEKPVIVRFVTEGGPSVDKLLPGDQIWRINGEDVKSAPRDHVIQLVRSCKDTVRLAVCQPPLDNSTRKSALLSAAKKAKLKSNPSRVRFAEGVIINGTTLPLGQSSTTLATRGDEQAAPLMPNVMKVYLENGQTKSFKYDSATTVADVLNSLQQKLGFKSMDHFSLCVEHVKSIRKNKLTLLDPAESLAWIAARPGAHNLRCMLRIAFVPKDAYDLLRKDTGAFEYLFMQCCNDVVQERFAPELKYDIALRIAALHMHQHALANKMQAKLTVKNVEREYGLERFVPTSLVEAMKRKELRKLLSHFFKLNQQLTAPGQKQLTALQAKLHYLKIIAELPSYGAKCFSTNFKSDANVETVILVSPKFGISQISGLRSSAPLTLCNVEDITSLNIRREDELTQFVEIRLKDPDRETLLFSLEERDSEELILVLRGYHKLSTERVLPIHRERTRWTQDSAPPYHTKHTVQPALWSFVDRSEPADPEEKPARYADLSVPPPYHPPPPGFQVPSARYPSAFPEGSAEFEDPEEDPAGAYDPARPASGVSLALSPQPGNGKLDSNMNKPLPNNNQSSTVASPLARDPARRVSTLETAVPGHKLGFDMPSVVSMEILESEPQLVQPAAADCSEARNDAVIQRVSELKRLVEDAEQYLTCGSAERASRASDVETSSLLSDMSALSKTESDLSGSGAGGPGYGRLRHSDSLLLLTQGAKQLSLPDNTTVLLDAEHGSSSDTDSVNTTPNQTPTHSPSQRPKADGAKHGPPSMLKPSDSSFGLHSPDVLPAEQQDLEGLLKRLKDDLPLPDGSLIYIDPDIIDLTMIPPPITPEEDGLAIKFPTTINAPPTPFADRDSLENELAAMKPDRNRTDLGDLDGLNDISQWSNTSDSSAMNESADLNESRSTDTLSLSGISAASRSIESLASSSRSSSAGSISAATVIENKSRRPVTGDKLKNPELDKFLSSVAIPLPPGAKDGRAAGQDFSAADDLSAFIIPPPPANTGANASNMDVLQKLYAARDGIFQVMRDDAPDEKDRANCEVKVRFEQRESPSHGVSPKIGELQRMLAGGAGSESLAAAAAAGSAPSCASGSATKGTTPDLSPASSHSSGYGSLKSIAECSASSAPPELPARQPAGQISPRKNGYAHFHKVPALNPVNGSLRAPALPGAAFRPSFLDDDDEDDDIPPPPPPPRNPIPRMILASAAHARAAQKSMETIAIPPPGPLTKSSSQGDLLGRASAASSAVSGRLGEIQRMRMDELSAAGRAGARGMSASTDSISTVHKSGASSPSKLSMASSSDSIGSNASVATVKNAPAAAKVTTAAIPPGDQTPPLPPRNSPTRVVMKQAAPQPPAEAKVTVTASRIIRPPAGTAPVESASKPPALPSRLSKPGSTSPQKMAPKPPAAINGSPGRIAKPAAPPPPPLFAGSSTSSSHYAIPSVAKPTGSPVKRSEYQTPNSVGTRLARPVPTPTAPPSKAGAPLSTSSPKLVRAAGNNVISLNIRADGGKADDRPTWSGPQSPRQRKPSGVTLPDRDGSVDSGSFEQDSLDGSTDFDLAALISQSEVTVNRVITQLGIPASSTADRSPSRTDDDAGFSEAARERLINESRSFVTASKMFVKSVTDTPQNMAVCLSQCVVLVERMGVAVEAVARLEHNRDLPPKVRDVARAFLHTLKAAAEAAGQGVSDPSMGRLMSKATALAGVLTILMRSLRP